MLGGMRGLWLVAVGMVACGTAWADDFSDVPVEVSIEQQAVESTDKIDNSRPAPPSAPAPGQPFQPGLHVPAAAGTGQSVDRNIAFSATLHNKGMDDLANVGIKLYVMAGPNSYNTDQTRLRLHVVQVLSQDNIAILSAQDAHVALGNVDFASKTATSVQRESNGLGQNTVVATTSYSGDISQGYVVEIYIDGKLADVRIGNGSMKSAYEDYLLHARGAAANASDSSGASPSVAP